MKNFLKVDLFVKISGYEINEEEGTFQIQNISFDNGKLLKHTVKIHKLYKEDSLKALIGKTVKVEEPKEYKNGIKVFYAGSDIKKVDIDEDFKINREITLKVDNIIESTSIDKNTNKKLTHSTIQSIISNGTRTDLFNIKIKNTKKIELDNLKGKEVVVRGVNVATTDFGTFYSSVEKPILLNQPKA
ncbi:hypothetical protein CP965_12980 [Halarcobacter mediterraneus]|uniref:Uncharacterized protein n=1 Tax=Halarcobacter mediterraneus TaxID=2023153 RepID=A0A4Q1AT98_9BACT|nr:hypothetical protein [Halarcobacter mediterraneus]RXK11678.1 hypothetical protein CP965_12980 [Halarcobacter mediterraneus]